MLGNLNGGVFLGGRRTADEQGRRKARPLQFLSDGDHFVERRRDQAGETDEVGLEALGLGYDTLRARHHTEVGHGVVIAREDHANDVLADVVDIALDGCDEERALRGAADFLGGHEGFKVGDGRLHHAGGADDLREEHLSFAEELADDAHAVHQRSFDNE